MKPGWGVRVRREEDTAWQGTREMVKPLLTWVMLWWPGDRREQNTAPFPSAALASAHLGPRCTETFGTSLPNTYYVLALGWNADDEDTVLTPPRHRGHSFGKEKLNWQAASWAPSGMD